MIGRQIGSYRITKLLGEGGMGAVYQATDNIEREVAIKALRPQLTHDETRLERFRSEAVALGRLHHPNITSLFHLLEENDSFYMVMEFVEGHTLDELVRHNGPLPPRLALDILIDALHGFEHAHSRGVIHRDIKASNLMVSTEGTTKIMDFGIARMDGGARLTQNGQRIGTLEYMSPEQVRGLEQDARSDIYSLGILLFELLTGRVPFTDANDFDLMSAHLEKAPPSVRHLVPSLPLALDEVIAKALAKAPAGRFQNALELRLTLEAIAAQLPDASISQAPIIAPAAQPTRPTNVQVPNQRHATMTIEDRYGTRLQGTPLPAPPAPLPVAPAPPVPTPAASPSSPTESSTRRWKFIAIGAIVGVALLMVIFVALGIWRPRANQATSSQTTVLRPSQTSRATTALIQPKRAVTSPNPPARRVRVRRAAQPSRVVRIPKPRRVRSKVAQQHSPRASQTRIVKRPQTKSRANSGGEKAALRAIIKGN